MNNLIEPIRSNTDLSAAFAQFDPDAQADVTEALHRWASAFNAADLDAIAALYDPHAVLWGTLATALIDSPAGISRYFQRVFAALPPPQVVLGEGLLRVLGDAAIHSGGYVLSVGLPGGELRSLAARFSFTYRRGDADGRWLIVDHHSSLMPGLPV